MSAPSTLATLMAQLEEVRRQVRELADRDAAGPERQLASALASSVERLATTQLALEGEPRADAERLNEILDVFCSFARLDFQRRASITGDGLVDALASSANMLAEELAAALQDRDRAMSSVVHAERLASMGTMALGLAHEINNPLTYISGNLLFIRENLSQPGADLEGALDDAALGADRIRAIVSQVREFGTRDAQHRQDRWEVASVVQFSLKLAAHRLRDRAQVVVDVPKDLWAAGDPAQMSQLLVNLLVNAGDALPDGAASDNRVCVRAWTEDEEVHVAVEDTGIGIAASSRTQVFDPFFTTKRFTGGLGLGLSIAHRIVTEASGSISVQDNDPRGCRLLVRLPRQTPPVASAPTEHPSPARGMRLLLVEDDAQVRRVLLRLLSDIEIVCVDDGHEAIERLEVERFDFVISDLSMPRVSGAELYAHTARRHPHLAERFLLISGGATSEALQRFLSETSLPVMTKPLDARALRKWMASRPTAE